MSEYLNDPQIKGTYILAFKHYAKLRKYKKRQFKQSILDKLDMLQTNNPNDYWKCAHSLRENSKESPAKGIDGKDWFDYFTKLSSVPKSLNERIEQMNGNKTENNLNNNSSNLNFRTAFNELNAAICFPKNNKSAGMDGLCYEMFKYAQSFIVNCLHKLYNAVL
ncbi:unnamed protein product [Mytilus coruscus]|uniref:Uncharacterized protein n=1 Tax=Mytilus coruscus TaxID=42192 RepID=A0A6J8D2X4_MYTCO|nr:unnamed protein product [Mytilus coruscus]